MSYGESSGSDSDTGLEDAMEALKRAFTVTGADDDLSKSPAADGATDESEDEDIELLRSIRQRFSVATDEFGTEHESMSMKPLQTILPSSLSDENDDFGDDFETLRAIQRRFSQYDDSMNICMESPVQRSEQVGATNNIDLGKESSPNFFVERFNNGRGFPDCVDGRATNQSLDVSSNITSDIPNANSSEGHEPGSELVPVTDDSFPRSAQAFVEAIKKNRTCQKLIRNKLAQLGARMEENRKLRERVKLLKDFQTACRTRTGRALSQKKDARIQLISIPKQRSNASKLSKDKNTPAIYQGPAENSHVAHYRNALSKYPFSLSREPWSKEEKENLLKGIRQQFQEMLMRNLLGGGDGDSSYRVNMIKKIKDHKITDEEFKSFLDMVNWERLASIYVSGRSASECESRWRNCEDPSINHGTWSRNEDKKLLHIVSNQGLSNWIKIAMELKTNRTPFQCLSRFQRSLNASIIKNEWTPPEDEELRKAVAEYGETNWQLVASNLEGRTGTQCSNRWKKTLNPLRKRVGKWDPDENKRLKIAVRLFGAKNWNKIFKFVPGRTQVQCRERWFNCLDPRLNMNEWTEDEDLKLKKAIEVHGTCWSRIAASIPPRTDNQCRRRWMVLLPQQVSIQRVARKLKKTALISNFVDREGERPDLTIKDFVTPLLIESDPKANEDCKILNKKKQRIVFKRRCRRARKVTHTEKVFIPNDEDDVAENNGHGDITTNGVGPVASFGDNLETKKQATGKWKGNKRDVPNIRSRRARQVTHTEKVLRLIDEDDVEYNDGHAIITGFLDNTSVENSRQFDRDVDCGIERKASVKQKWNEREKEDEEMVGGISNKGELKVYVRRHKLKRCRSFIDSEEKELEDEETLGSFLIDLKKKRRRLL